MHSAKDMQSKAMRVENSESKRNYKCGLLMRKGSKEYRFLKNLAEVYSVIDQLNQEDSTKNSEQKCIKDKAIYN